MPLVLFRKFIKLESSGGIVLFVAALIALVLDNSPLSSQYEQLLELPLGIHLGDVTITKTVLHWINDGLMVLFFLLVGLEIKRELVEGELNSTAKVILPASAAIGGMLIPAAIFIAFNYDNSYAMRGWAIPTATDIAFSLGILSLLGSRVPVTLKVFLTALAIFDDLGAILIIAVFYTSNISFNALGLAAAWVFALGILNIFNIRGYILYFIVGICLWASLLKSGIHATLAGVILALAIPLRNPREKRPNFSPSERLEELLHPWIAYGVLPIFAFANAGVSLNDLPPGINSIFSPVTLGIALGLFFGKMIGVFFTSYLAIRVGIAEKPRGSTWPQIFGIALVCGVGFTMSFFVGALAYPNGTTTEPYAAWVRLGVILGSLLSGLLGYFVLHFTGRQKE